MVLFSAVKLTSAAGIANDGLISFARNTHPSDPVTHDKYSPEQFLKSAPFISIEPACKTRKFGKSRTSPSRSESCSVP